MQPSEQDYRAIEQLLYRYAWMVDRRKWELMDEVFAPGGTIDYASTGGPGAMPYRAALEWLDRALKPWPLNLHHITNISIDSTGTGVNHAAISLPRWAAPPLASTLGAAGRT
jgi:hypothetical protein